MDHNEHIAVETQPYIEQTFTRCTLTWMGWRAEEDACEEDSPGRRHPADRR